MIFTLFSRTAAWAPHLQCEVRGRGWQRKSLDTLAVVCPSKPMSLWEEQRWPWTAGQGHAHCGERSWGSVWVQQGQLWCRAQKILQIKADKPCNLTFIWSSQHGSIHFRRAEVGERALGRLCLIRCVSFPHAVFTRGRSPQFVFEGREVRARCGGIHCVWRGLALDTCHSFQALLNWVERKRFSVRCFTDQGKNLWFYPGWGDQSQADRQGKPAACTGGTYPRGERGFVPTNAFFHCR